MLALYAFLLAFGLNVLADNSTTNVFLPIVDAQPLVASLSASSNDIKTLIVQCPDGTESSKCGFPTPVTVTAGPSTVALTTTIGNSMTVDLKCGVEGSTKARCTQIYTGPASLKDSTVTGDDGSKTITWTASQTLESGKVTYLPVTITAGMPSSTGSKGAAAAVETGVGIKRVAVVIAVAQLVRAVI